ncbi:MAG TPA: T9SS type A sorting domain-containing protein [Chitinophagaceae bacterium]
MKKLRHLFRSADGKKISIKMLYHNKKIIAKFFVFLLFQIGFLKSEAQVINDNGSASTVLANGSYQDFVIPNNPQIAKISFFLVGADGGAAFLHMGQYVPLVGFAEIGTYESAGGTGARVSVTFLVGSGTGKIPLGSEIRFIVGKKGTSGHADVNIIPDGGTGSEYGGGGGGTAILYRRPGGTWELLAVAGGGGGAYQGVILGSPLGLGSNGGGGREGESGGDGSGAGFNSDGGSNGEGGEYGDMGAGGGGSIEEGSAINGCIYPWEESNPSVGEGGAGGINGGYGGTDEGCDNFFDISNGGFGFGGGGIGHISGGGGGGYSGGGGGGFTGAGGGGGSYVNAIWYSMERNPGGYTYDPKDGYVVYNVILNLPPVAECKDMTINLNGSGQATLAVEDINNGSSDPNDDALTYSLSKTSYSCIDVGTHTVTLTVTDPDGASSTCTATVTVVDNTAPTVVTKNITAYLDANGQVTITPAQVDNGSSDNCSIQNRALNITSFSCDDIGANTVTLTVTDVNGNSASNTATVTVVDNLGPIITSVTPDPAFLWPPDNKMKTVNIAIVSTDNCPGNGITCNVIGVSSNEVDNDGIADGEITGNNTVALRAERWGTGTGRIYTITVQCTDGSGNSSQATTTVLVAHNISSPKSGAAFKIGSTVNLLGEFWDMPGNRHTAKWLIDETTGAKATVTEPSGNKNGKVTGTYKFTTAGVYKLRMNITDQNGVTSYANTNGDLDAIVVIYDPNGGHTYGGGYFNSPAGALVSDPSSTGKASYGFTMNYFKNSTYPKGETQFEFKVGDFEFNALNFEYLVISNSMAQFKGTGKIIGGQSGIGFTMTVVDGQLDGTGIDKIRMKIYNKNTGEIIYDNQPGASDAALATQAVGANSVIVISGTNPAITKSNASQQTEKESLAEKTTTDLDVIVYPNPTTSDFSVTVQANAKEKIVMQVVDMYGRVIETRNVTANSLVRFGGRYVAGTYFVRVMHGKEHRELKLIKF